MYPDEFWEMVKKSLLVGKISMIFVADVIPPELKRIVEFLDKQMDPAEVMALEVKQYVGEGLKTLVPRLIIPSDQLQMKLSMSPKILDETSFLEHLDDVGENFYRELLDFARENQLLIVWSAKGFSLYVVKMVQMLIYLGVTVNLVHLVSPYLRLLAA